MWVQVERWKVTLWLRKRGGFKGDFDISNGPCPSVCARGITGVGHGQYWIEDDGKQMKQSTDKPPYRVPSMPEINALPSNGLKVASTFSGCGGSCLGYRMAGYKVVWANEFVPAAQDSYRANKVDDCILDTRDIRTVKPEDILEATGLEVGELDLFDGSPPCQAFSTAGKREKGWGKGKKYEHGAVQCNEQLFDEYIRLIRGLKPRTFVAENVSGLVKGAAKGMFLEILRDLKGSGYRVKAKVIDAQWLGVPQARQRVIFVGVRDDLGLDPVHPKPLKYRYSVRDAVPGVQDGCHIEQHHVFDEGVRRTSIDGPSPTVSRLGLGAQRSGRVMLDGRKFTIDELRRICAFPDDFILTGSYAQQWERLGNSVPPVMMRAVAEVIRDQVLLTP